LSLTGDIYLFENHALIELAVVMSFTGDRSPGQERDKSGQPKELSLQRKIKPFIINEIKYFSAGIAIVARLLQYSRRRCSFHLLCLLRLHKPGNDAEPIYSAYCHPDR
jgi:hypothetical protein